MAALTVRQTSISDNVGITGGGGVWLQAATGEMRNILLVGNTSYGDGGGLRLEQSDISLVNLTVADNVCYGQGGGLYIDGDPAAPMSLSSSIVSGNDGIYGIYENGGSLPALAWDDVWDNQLADYGGSLTNPTGIDGNISQDPLFTDPVGGDYTLQAGSPCVDAGNPDPAHDDVDGTPNDMGAWGGPFGGW
jgi:hypothetical protein